jgi:hypothetical protein
MLAAIAPGGGRWRAPVAVRVVRDGARFAG